MDSFFKQLPSSTFLKYLVGIFTIGVVLKLLQVFVFSHIVESAFYGNSLPYLNELITKHRVKAPEERTLLFYLTEINAYTNRTIGILCFFYCVLVFLLKNKALALRTFLFEERTSFSLGIFRICLAFILLLSDFPGKVDHAASLGSQMIIPPPGWDPSFISLLLYPTLIFALKFLFIASLIGTLLGIFTNKMLAIAVFSGFFLMGIPQFFGKIDHYHIFWQCLVILLLSDSGSSLSIDAWRSKKQLIPKEKSLRYDLPIKFIMILIGITYLFPGMWKFIFSGFEWAFSDNLRNKLHSGWIEANWTPFFRIDRHPFVYQSMAFVTLVFELTFLPALFHKKTRTIVVLIALIFHLSVFFLMKINFFGHLALFVVFIPWDRLHNFITKTNVSSSRAKKETGKQKLLISISSILIFFNLITGSLLIDTWPFGVYPTFASVESDTIPSILIEYTDEKNEKKTVIPLLSTEYKEVFGPKLRPFLNRLYSQKELSMDDLKLLTNPFMNKDTLKALNIYSIRLSKNPDNPAPVFKKEHVLYTAYSD